MRSASKPFSNRLRRLLYIGAGAAFAVLSGLFFVTKSAVRSSPSPKQPPSNLLALSSFQGAIIAELQRQRDAGIVYRADYFAGGEPPPQIGVCTDVVLRAYHAAEVPLQKQVNDDIAAHRGLYPLTRPDPNIDHRRCRNLIVFFRRHAQTLPNDRDWKPGDIVFWDTPGTGGVDHVGVLGTRRNGDNDLSVVHHWPGRFVRETDNLYSWKIRGHFRWKS